MSNLRLFPSRRGLLTTACFGLAMSVLGIAVPAKAEDISGVWITQKNKYGEVIRIDFAANGTYRRIYELSPGDFTIETGRYEVQRNGSVRLYNIRWSNPGMRSNPE